MEYIKVYLYHLIMGYGMLGLFIYGSEFSIDGLENIGITWFSISSILSFIYLSDKAKEALEEEYKKTEKKYLPISIGIIFSFLTIMTFAYYGYVTMVILITLSSIIMQSSKYEAIKKIKSEGN